ncbi:MAG: biotin/lipoyl-containing protein [Terriglobales bacterium]|jgi:biotin carboxyl carrier protein
MLFDLVIAGQPHRLELQRSGTTFACTLNGKPVQVDAVLSRPSIVSLLIDGKSYEVKRELTPADMHIWVNGARYSAEIRDPRSLQSRRSGEKSAAGPKKLTAPMPGKVLRVLVKEKDAVEAQQGVIVIEAMKMQNELKSPKPGVVQKILAAEGATVNPGDVLMVIE